MPRGYRNPACSSHGRYVKAKGLRRGRPDREPVVVGDRTCATLWRLAACQCRIPPITVLPDTDVKLYKVQLRSQVCLLGWGSG